MRAAAQKDANGAQAERPKNNQKIEEEEEEKEEKDGERVNKETERD